MFIKSYNVTSKLHNRVWFCYLGSQKMKGIILMLQAISYPVSSFHVISIMIFALSPQQCLHHPGNISQHAHHCMALHGRVSWPCGAGCCYARSTVTYILFVHHASVNNKGSNLLNIFISSWWVSLLDRRVVTCTVCAIHFMAPSVTKQAWAYTWFWVHDSADITVPSYALIIASLRT